MWGCRALESVLSLQEEPKEGWNKSNLSHCYEWRLNMQSGKVKERRLCREHVMDFPMINAKFTGLKNKFGYAQVVDVTASAIAGKFQFSI